MANQIINTLVLEIKSKKISKIDTKSYKSILNEKELNELIKNLNENQLLQ